MTVKKNTDGYPFDCKVCGERVKTSEPAEYRQVDPYDEASKVSVHLACIKEAKAA